MAQATAPGTSSRFVNEADLEYIAGLGGLGKFEPRVKTLSRQAGGKQLVCNLVELQPGKAGWPFHFHLAEEEAIYVLSGKGTMRLGKEKLPAKPGDYFALLPGLEETAHQMINTSDSQVLHYLCMAVTHQIDICGYPDSKKVFVGADSADGNPMFRKIFHQDTPELDYYAGE